MTDSKHPLRDPFDSLGRAIPTLTEGRHYIIDLETGCWVWQKYKTALGYGRCNGGWAHRVMLIQCGQELEKGQPVHHICRNPSCVNPDHLEATDTTTHMRGHWWERAGMTPEKVAEIRQLTAETTLTQREIALRCGVSREAVVRIANARAWDDEAEVRKPPRTCRWCGQPVSDDRRRQATYCCPEHRVKYNNRKLTERRRSERQEVAA